MLGEEDWKKILMMLEDPQAYFVSPLPSSPSIRTKNLINRESFAGPKKHPKSWLKIGKTLAIRLVIKNLFSPHLYEAHSNIFPTQTLRREIVEAFIGKCLSENFWVFLMIYYLHLHMFTNALHLYRAVKNIYRSCLCLDCIN